MTVMQNATVSLQEMSRRLRVNCLRMGHSTGQNGAHFGSALSLVEIMVALYFGVMKYDPVNVSWEDRDRLILSKGHGAMAYYAAMKELGLVSFEELMTFKSDDTHLYGHPSMNRERGIEFSSGSLGLGLSLGVGTSFALRMKGNDARVFVILGDGECNEGSVWEAAMSASQFDLSSLTAIVDKNGLQYDGVTSSVLNMDPLDEKWRSFGWEVRVVDGHDPDALVDALAQTNDKPLVVIADTIKGKGIDFMENNPGWHHNRLSDDQLLAALKQLDGEYS